MDKGKCKGMVVAVQFLVLPQYYNVVAAIFFDSPGWLVRKMNRKREKTSKMVDKICVAA